jgi:hypothetical protein
LLGHMPDTVRARPAESQAPAWAGAEDGDARDRSLPPLEARDVVIRICDDKTLHEQIRRAIRQTIEAQGVQAFGDMLIGHSEAKYGQLASEFYDSYYFVLAGDPKQDPPVEGYLAEIGYGGRRDGGVPITQMAPPPAAPSVPAGNESAGAAVICPTCGASLPPGSRFCPKDGPLPAAAEGIEKYCPQCPGRAFKPDDRFCNVHGELQTRSVAAR